MALSNIIKPSNQVQNSQGRPLAGGSVYLYTPGTTDFITAYGDSGLTTPLTEPVVLSGSGRSNIWITRDCDLFIYDRNGNLVVQELNANPDEPGASESGGLVPNGSFEIDTDVNGVPDGWTKTSESGSTNARSTVQQTDGLYSFAFASTGVGGGTLKTTDFFPVNDADDLSVNFDIRATVISVRNRMRVEWYDSTFVSISDTDVYDSTALAANTWVAQQTVATPPALARFAKLKMIGIDPSVALSGTVYFDRVSVFYPQVVAGVFDNITIQNNTISTTNTNGALNLTPDGTGAVILNYSAAPKLSTFSGGAVINTSANTATPPAGSPGIGTWSWVDLSGTDLLGQLGFNSTFDMRLENRIHGGGLVFTIEDSAGNTETAFAYSADAAATLYHAGVAKLGTTATGILAYSSISIATPPVDNPGFGYLQLFDLNGTDALAILGFNNSINLDINSTLHGGAVRVMGENAAGTARTMMTASPVQHLSTLNSADGRWNVEYAGAVKFNSASDGMVLRSDISISTPPTANPGYGLFSIYDADYTDLLAQLGFGNSQTLLMVNRVRGGSLAFLVTDAAGNTETAINVSTDANVDLYFGGGIRLSTTTGGATVTGSLFDLNNAGAGTETYSLLRNSNGGIALGVDSSGDTRLAQTSSSSTVEDALITFARNAGLILYANNVSELQTVDHSAAAKSSGAEVKDFGGTFRPVGFNVMPFAVNNSATTISRTHLSTLQDHQSGTVAWTTPASSDTDFPVGGVVSGVSAAAGLTIAAGAGVTLSWFNGASVSTGTRTIAAGGAFSLYRASSTAWYIWGNGIS